MRCPHCKAKTKVLSTEKAHTMEARFMPKETVKELVEEWGESACFRKRSCTNGHSLITIEFCLNS